MGLGLRVHTHLKIEFWALKTQHAPAISTSTSGLPRAIGFGILATRSFGGLEVWGLGLGVPRFRVSGSGLRV